MIQLTEQNRADLIEWLRAGAVNRVLKALENLKHVEQAQCKNKMVPEQITALAQQVGGVSFTSVDAIAFTEAQLIEFIRRVREHAFEEAAQACEFLQGCCPSIDHMECAEAIRRLKCA